MYNLKFVFDGVSIRVDTNKDVEVSLKEIYNNNQDNPYQFMVEVSKIVGVDIIGTELK